MDEAQELSDVLKTYYAQYVRFDVLNDICTTLGNSCVKNGIPQIFDYMDMNCGAIPEGSFPEIIDLSAPIQFLKLYTQIAESRFAYVVSQILRIYPDSLNELCEFMYGIGQQNKIPNLDTPHYALQVYESVVLDGLLGDNPKKIIEESEEKIVWTNTIDTHKKYWDKAKCNLSIYYELIQSFMNGILEDSGMQLIIENNSIFTISK